MSKLLMAALLALFSTSAMAEWTMVGGNDDQTTYADLSTIRKSGNKVKMWDLFDYKVVMISKTNGTRRLSSVTFMEYDCKEETARQLAFNYYSKNMGAGEMVYMSRNQHEEPEPITPGTTGETVFKIACGK